MAPPGWPESLSDSNVDWGQGLVELAAWSREHAPNGLYLAYFGNAPPAAWGVDAVPLPAFGPLDGSEPPLRRKRPRPSAVGISVVNLHGLYLEQPALYAAFRDEVPVATLAGSIRVWSLEGRPDLRAALADACRQAGWKRTAAQISRSE